MRILSILTSFLFFCTSGYSQFIRGTITDIVNNNVIANASIYINNSTLGTTSSQGGKFQLQTKGLKKIELIVSHIGYNRYIQEIILKENEDLNLSIKLSPEEASLENVVIEPYEKEDWKKWGRYFLNVFLGENEAALKCKVLNTDDITFRYFKKSKRLVAIAKKPLVVVNDYLGYNIKYDLMNFEADFNSNMTNYSGLVLFTEKDEKTKKKYIKNREKAYEGSKTEFLRSTFTKSWQEDGFEVKRMYRIYNAEKERMKEKVKLLVNNHIAKHGRFAFNVDSLIGNKDTIAYYHQKSREDNYEDVFSPHFLTPDSIIIATQPTTKDIYFNDYLYIVSKKAKEEKDYMLRYNINRAAYYQRSNLYLIEKNVPIRIFSDGNYAPTEQMIHFGYWSWRENVSTMLPSDYYPEKDLK